MWGSSGHNSSPSAVIGRDRQGDGSSPKPGVHSLQDTVFHTFWKGEFVFSIYHTQGLCWNTLDWAKYLEYAWIWLSNIRSMTEQSTRRKGQRHDCSAHYGSIVPLNPLLSHMPSFSDFVDFAACQSNCALFSVLSQCKGDHLIYIEATPQHSTAITLDNW